MTLGLAELRGESWCAIWLPTDRCEPSASGRRCTSPHRSAKQRVHATS